MSEPIKRGERGKWLPGQSANPSGKPKGIGELQALARSRTVYALARLSHIARRGTEGPAVRAAEILLDRGWGKAPQTIHFDRISPEDLKSMSEAELQALANGDEDAADAGEYAN
jgi:hypothetical protein